MYLLDKNFHPPVETKPDTFSLDALIAWMETKPADEIYNWRSTGACLLHQYIDHANLDMAYHVFVDKFRAANGFCVQPVASAVSEATYPYSTFGAALGRARAAKVRT